MLVAATLAKRHQKLAGRIRLLADGGGGDDQRNANTEENHEETGPGNESLGSELVALTTLRPGIGGVDGGVSINVGTILALELVDTIALALAARGVNPVLLLHGLRLAHEVELDSLVLDRVKTLLADVNLLAIGNDNGADVLASARGLGLEACAREGFLSNGGLHSDELGQFKMLIS